MRYFAGKSFRERITLIPVTTVMVAALIAVAVGVVAPERWTASARVSGRADAGQGCGRITPTVMPSAGCQDLLTRMYLGAPAPCGTIEPQSMPSLDCRHILERIFLGTVSP